MGDMKSYVEFYSKLTEYVHTSIAECFGVSQCVIALERSKISRRIAAEGLQFLTVTLPRLGKAFDKALSSGTAFNPQGFEKIPGTTTPKLLGWLSSRVFDDTGILRKDVSIEAVKHYRQFVYLLYKLELPYATKTCEKVIEAFVQTEVDLANCKIDESDQVIRMARSFTTRCLGDFDHRDIHPRHGPGAVATGETGLSKACFKRIYSSIEAIYPFTEYFCFNMGHVADELQEIESLETLETGTAKVVLVPKDSRGPRLISCEPLEYQWIQQGIAKALVSRLESSRFTAGHVNFTDQTVNQRLALLGSISGDYVTLDMKEASDRVSTELVTQLFQGTPLLEGLLATRSGFTKLPDGRVIALKKFAPMGSALCFPVEAFVFYALAVAVLRVHARYTWRKAMESVWVYGDDLIILGKDFPLILQHLPKFGLLFNEGKCCTAGFFRESCGCDAFKGVDVTPIKLRSVWDTSKRRTDPGGLASYVSYSNSLYLAGYYEASQFIEDAVRKVYPFVPHNNDVNTDTTKVGWKSESPKGISFYRPHIRAAIANTTMPKIYSRVEKRWQAPMRYNKKLHRMEVYTPMVMPVLFRGHAISGWRQMLYYMNKAQRTEPGRYTLPRRVYIKRGWTPLVD